MSQVSSELADITPSYRLQWVAPADDLIYGRCVTNFRLVLLSWGRSQKLLSNISGVAESRISEYAQGKRPISASNLLKLARALRREPTDLIGVTYGSNGK